MTNKARTEELKNKVVKKMTASIMKKMEQENLLKMLRGAELIHPECKEIALKLRALCRAEDDRTPPIS